MLGPPSTVEITSACKFVRFVEKPGDALDYAGEVQRPPLVVMALPTAAAPYPSWMIPC
jgi:hypothetical protein